MIYGSVCSGVEAASLAWEPLGWKPAWFSEIDKFPSAVLAHRYPEVPNLGDMTRLHEDERFRTIPIDLLVGGTPCQSFSVAGLRKGMADPRGNLALSFLGLADKARPRWVVWENVPGVLSANGGRDFGSFVTALGQLGYGWAYRVMDAQFVGGCSLHGGRPVPQRRRRVFVVGYLGDWTRAAAVLFESHSLRGDFKKSGRKKKAVAALTATGVGTCGADDNQAQAGHLIAHTLRGEGFDASEDGTGRGTPLVPITFNARQDPITSEKALPLDTDGTTQAVMFDPYNNAVSDKAPSLGTNCGMSTGRNIAVTPQVFEARFVRNGRGAPEDVCPPLKAQSGESGKGDSAPLLNTGLAVRRLLPVECERLQGMPDNWTKVPWRGKPASECADGPRYKAIGNSMAVPCMRWIGRRIQAVEELTQP